MLEAHAEGMNTSPHIRIAAAGLVLGPLLLSVADLLRKLVVPAGSSSDIATTQAVAQNGGLWLASAMLSVLGAYCFVFGTVGLIATAHGRGSRVTMIGAVMVGFGAIAWIGHSLAMYAEYAWFVAADTPPAQIEALSRVTDSYPLVAILIVLFMVGLTLGPIVLLVGLRRARRVPIWAVVAVAVYVVCSSTDGMAASVLGLVASLAAFVPAARSLTVAEPDMRRARGRMPADA